MPEKKGHGNLDVLKGYEDFDLNTVEGLQGVLALATKQRLSNEISFRSLTAITSAIQILMKQVQNVQKRTFKAESTVTGPGEPTIPIREFVESSAYLGQPPLSERQLKVLERFFAQDSTFSELVLLWGKGSGKDHVASIIILYLVYLTLRKPDPQGSYGLPADSSIDFINVAQSAPQAERVFFEGSLKTKLNHSPYFKQLGFEATRDLIRFPKGIRAISTHSQNESYEGYNILGFVMDEAAAFRSETKIANADKIYNTLRTSMMSRFPHDGRGCILSYPRHEGDFIMTKYEDAKRHSWILADKGSTWEVNPLRVREDFDEEFTRDPIDAAAKYECRPPMVEDAFLPPEHLNRCFTGANHKLADLQTGPEYVISLDPAIYADRFATVIGHSENGKAIVDSAQFVKGSRQKPVVISEVEAEIGGFCERNDGTKIITDSHELVSSVQKWQSLGYSAEIVSVAVRDQMEQWSALKNAVIAEAVQLPDDPELRQELSHLRIKRSGDLWKVEAAEGEFDDLSDATARLVWSLGCSMRTQADSGMPIAIRRFDSFEFGPSNYYRMLNDVERGLNR